MTEDVTRNGRFVRVTVGSVSRERDYKTTARAERAYKVLMFDKAARELFLRIGKVRGKP